MAEHLGPSHVPPSSSQIYKAQAAAAALKFAMAQEASSEEFVEWSEMDAFNPLAMSRRFETLEIKTRRKRDDESEKSEKAEKKEERHVTAIKFENVAQEFQRRNHELQSRTLLLLRAMIKETDTKEDVLRKVLEIYSDYTLADEALDYLLETTEGPLAESVRAAKEELNTLYGREVRAGKNIAAMTTEFSTKGLGSPTALRDLYRDVTGNPRDANTLFQQLASTFTFERMQVVIGFLLHSLGADLKAKGPSIPRAELHRLISEGRSLQAILGLYRFFFSRMPLIKNAFSRQELMLPGRLTFDLMARLY
ncbi:MAG TPA: type III secretion system gatekeeper subunit SctW, partial [Rhabdochlamydiaceae bacterium]